MYTVQRVRAKRTLLIIITIEYLVKISSNDVNVTSQSFQVIVSFFGAQVAGAQNVLDFARNEKFFEFRVHRIASMRNVKIAGDENQHLVSPVQELFSGEKLVLYPCKKKTPSKK